MKGEKKRPIFKPSKLDKETDKPKDNNSALTTKKKRAGSKRRAKNATLVILEERVIKPKDDIPSGSGFKGYRDFVVQALRIETQNARYRLARGVTPDGQTLLRQ